MKKISNYTMMAVFAFSLIAIPLALSTQKASAASLPSLTRDCNTYTFSYGDRYMCVVYIQAMLNGVTNAGHLPQWYIGTDGIFGYNTRSKVYEFQKYAGLQQDGVVGSKTWAKLCVAAREPAAGSTANWATNDAGCWD